MGLTTGTCAAAAAKAATLLLCGKMRKRVDVLLPDGTRENLPIAYERKINGFCEAAVRKDAGADPDVTHGALVLARAAWNVGAHIVISAKDGIGTVTKPGLQVPPGEPAINPAPRRMILDAVREVTDKGVTIQLAIPGGRELAARTFNPRLGIQDGLSILGTTGRVRPFCVPALRDALLCALDVAVACGIRAPVFVPGNIGERAVRRHFSLMDEQVVQVSNEWGFMLEHAAKRNLDCVLVAGHPGKLAKLAMGHWDTHSSRSGMATEFVAKVAKKLGIAMPPDIPTVEGLFECLKNRNRQRLGNVLAAEIRGAVRLRSPHAVAVALINMAGDLLGADGDLSPWKLGT